MIQFLLRLLPVVIWMIVGAIIYSAGFKKGQDYQRKLDAEMSRREW